MDDGANGILDKKSMNQPESYGRDLRRYARGTTLRLILGFIFLSFVVGGYLIYRFYGPEALLFGLICIALGLAPTGIIALLLWMMDRIVKRARS